MAVFGQKTPKWIGMMTSLGFSGLSSQFISGFFGPFRPEKPETDPFRPENPETDWDDKPGLPRVVIQVRFGCFLALFGQKSPKWIGMTSLDFPGLSSQSISGYFCSFRPEKPETDWDDKPGLPKVVIPVCFGVFGLFSARKPQSGLG